MDKIDTRQDLRDSDGAENRLWSIDFFRGVVMFLLIGEATGLYELLVLPALNGSFVHSIGLQFQHHPWHGLTLWDLGQPFFMFISGVAMIFSYEKRWERGESWRATLGHSGRRAFILFVLGWALSHINPMEAGGQGEFLLDILPQLAFASLIAFLLLNRSVWLQVGFAIGLVVLTELLYRLWPLPGFDQPFIPGHNFGSYVDLTLFGRLSEGNWVAFNIIPATVHVILGVLAGRLLRSGKSRGQKLRLLVWAGLSGVIAGLALDPLTPIVKQICTSSFVLISGGLGLLALALAYWLIDVVMIRKGTVFFVCVGMNPMVIYLFALSGGGDWLRRIVEPFTMGFSGWIGDLPAQALTSLVIWGSMWALCYWLYRKKIFIKI